MRELSSGPEAHLFRTAGSLLAERIHPVRCSTRAFSPSEARGEHGGHAPLSGASLWTARLEAALFCVSPYFIIGYHQEQFIDFAWRQFRTIILLKIITKPDTPPYKVSVLRVVFMCF